jgi:low affinity Fe/Cu permease
MPIPSHHVELALYADVTAITATSCKPALLVSYLEPYLADFEHWLREWRIAINVSKSMVMLFTSRHIQNSCPVLLFREPIIWVDTAHYLGVTLDK